MSVSSWVLNKAGETNSPTWDDHVEIYPWVADVINAKTFYQALPWGRRTGKTFALALRAAIELSRPVVERQRSVVYFAPTKTQCDGFFYQVLELAKALGANLTTATKSRLRIESATAKVLMGTPSMHFWEALSPNVLMIDEACYIDQAFLVQQVRPFFFVCSSAQVGAVILVAGTPSEFKKNNKWFESWCESPEVRTSRITSSMLPRFDIDGAIQNYGPELYRREVLAEFPK